MSSRELGPGLLSLMIGLILAIIAAGILAGHGFCRSPPLVRLGVPVPYGSECVMEAFLLLLFLMTPPVVYLEFRYRVERKMVEQVPLFLREASTLIKSGAVFMQALLKASDVVDPRLGLKIKNFAYMIGRGIPLPQAYRILVKGLPSEPANLLYSLVEAYESGGRAGDILSLSAEYGFRLRDFDKQREAELKPYLYISAMALVVFNAAGLFLIGMAKSLSGIPAMGLSIGRPEEFASILFYSIIMVSIFSGLLSGKIVRGSVLYGLYYSFIFILIAFIFFIASWRWFALF